MSVVVSRCANESSSGDVTCDLPRPRGAACSSNEISFQVYVIPKYKLVAFPSPPREGRF